MLLLLLISSLLVSAHAEGYSKRGPSAFQVQQATVQDSLRDALSVSDIPQPYSFSFESGGSSGKTFRQETGDASGVVQGLYTVSDPRGHSRVVQYTADEQGFHADIQTDEPHQRTHSPANVRFVSTGRKGSVHGSSDSGIGSLLGSSHGKTSKGGGLRPAGFGVDDAQVRLGGGLGSSDRQYKIGQSQIPYGASGLDFYSYPDQRYTQSQVDTGISQISGPFGQQKVAPGDISQGKLHFTIGDSQQKSLAFGSGGEGRNYRTGQSQIPYGSSGFDYYSYPSQLYSQSKISGVGSKGTAGRGISPAFVGSIPALSTKGRVGGNSPFAQGRISRNAPSKTFRGQQSAGDLAAGSFQFKLGDSDISYKIGQSQIPYGASGLDYYSYPAQRYTRPQIKSPGVSKISRHAGSKGFSGAGIRPDFVGSAGGVSSTKGRVGGSGVFDQRQVQERISAVTPSKISQVHDLTGGIGQGNYQFTLGDSQVSHQIGQSQIPYGASGFDYYSYPSQRHTRPQPKTSGFGTTSSGIKGGIRGGSLGRTKGGIGSSSRGVSSFGGATKGGSQISQKLFTSGDVQRTSPAYRKGQSQIPYGASGLDYYSYPQRRYTYGQTKSSVPSGVKGAVIGGTKGGIASVSGIGKRGISTFGGAIKGGSQISQRPFTAGDFQRTSPAYRVGQSKIPYGASGLDYYSYPERRLSYGQTKSVVHSGVKGASRRGTKGGIGSSVVYSSGVGKGGVSTFGGGIKGGSQISQRPFTAGDIQRTSPAYRKGQSQIPYGASGLDFYSYPEHRLRYGQTKSSVPSGVKGTTLRGTKGGIGSVSGVGKRGISTFGGAVKGGSQISQRPFTSGDVQRTSPAYRTRQSQIPYGASGLDYYSYPEHRYTYGQTKSSGIKGVSSIGSFPGSSGVKGGLTGATVDGVKGSSRRNVFGTSVGGIKGGSSGLSLGSSSGGIKSGVSSINTGSQKRPYRVGQSSIPYGASGFDFSSYPSQGYDFGHTGSSPSVKTSPSLYTQTGDLGGIRSITGGRIKGGYVTSPSRKSRDTSSISKINRGVTGQEKIQVKLADSDIPISQGRIETGIKTAVGKTVISQGKVGAGSIGGVKSSVSGVKSKPAGISAAKKSEIFSVSQHKVVQADIGGGSGGALGNSLGGVNLLTGQRTISGGTGGSSVDGQSGISFSHGVTQFGSIGGSSGGSSRGQYLSAVGEGRSGTSRTSAAGVSGISSARGAFGDLDNPAKIEFSLGEGLGFSTYGSSTGGSSYSSGGAAGAGTVRGGGLRSRGTSAGGVSGTSGVAGGVSGAGGFSGGGVSLTSRGASFGGAAGAVRGSGGVAGGRTSLRSGGAFAGGAFGGTGDGTGGISFSSGGISAGGVAGPSGVTSRGFTSTSRRTSAGVSTLSRSSTTGASGISGSRGALGELDNPAKIEFSLGEGQGFSTYGSSSGVGAAGAGAVSRGGSGLRARGTSAGGVAGAGGVSGGGITFGSSGASAGTAAAGIRGTGAAAGGGIALRSRGASAGAIGSSGRFAQGGSSRGSGSGASLRTSAMGVSGSTTGYRTDDGLSKVEFVLGGSRGTSSYGTASQSGVTTGGGITGITASRGSGAGAAVRSRVTSSGTRSVYSGRTQVTSSSLAGAGRTGGGVSSDGPAKIEFFLGDGQGYSTYGSTAQGGIASTGGASGAAGVGGARSGASFGLDTTSVRSSGISAGRTSSTRGVSGAVGLNGARSGGSFGSSTSVRSSGISGGGSSSAHQISSGVGTAAQVLGGVGGTSGYSISDGPAKIEFRLGDGQGFSTYGASGQSGGALSGGTGQAGGFTSGSGAGRVGGTRLRSRPSASISGSGVSGGTASGSRSSAGISGLSSGRVSAARTSAGIYGSSGSAAQLSGGVGGTSGYSVLDGPAKIEFRLGDGQGFSTYGASRQSGGTLSGGIGGTGRADGGGGFSSGSGAGRVGGARLRSRTSAGISGSGVAGGAATGARSSAGVSGLSGGRVSAARTSVASYGSSGSAAQVSGGVGGRTSGYAISDGPAKIEFRLGDGQGFSTYGTSGQSGGISSGGIRGTGQAGGARGFAGGSGAGTVGGARLRSRTSAGISGSGVAGGAATGARSSGGVSGLSGGRVSAARTSVASYGSSGSAAQVSGGVGGRTSGYAVSDGPAKIEFRLGDGQGFSTYGTSGQSGGTSSGGIRGTGQAGGARGFAGGSGAGTVGGARLRSRTSAGISGSGVAGGAATGARSSAGVSGLSGGRVSADRTSVASYGSSGSAAQVSGGVGGRTSGYAVSDGPAKIEFRLGDGQGFSTYGTSGQSGGTLSGGIGGTGRADGSGGFSSGSGAGRVGGARLRSRTSAGISGSGVAGGAATGARSSAGVSGLSGGRVSAARTSVASYGSSGSAAQISGGVGGRTSGYAVSDGPAKIEFRLGDGQGFSTYGTSGQSGGTSSGGIRGTGQAGGARGFAGGSGAGTVGGARLRSRPSAGISESGVTGGTSSGSRSSAGISGLSSGRVSAARTSAGIYGSGGSAAQFSGGVGGTSGYSISDGPAKVEFQLGDSQGRVASSVGIRARTQSLGDGGIAYGSEAGREGGAGSRSRLLEGREGGAGSRSRLLAGISGVAGETASRARPSAGISGLSGERVTAARTSIASYGSSGSAAQVSGGVGGTSGYSLSDGPAKIEFRLGDGQGFSTYGASGQSGGGALSGGIRGTGQSGGAGRISGGSVAGDFVGSSGGGSVGGARLRARSSVGSSGSGVAGGAASGSRFSGGVSGLSSGRVSGARTSVASYGSSGSAAQVSGGVGGRTSGYAVSDGPAKIEFRLGDGQGFSTYGTSGQSGGTSPGGIRGTGQSGGAGRISGGSVAGGFVGSSGEGSVGGARLRARSSVGSSGSGVAGGAVSGSRFSGGVSGLSSGRVSGARTSAASYGSSGSAAQLSGGIGGASGYSISDGPAKIEFRLGDGQGFSTYGAAGQSGGALSGGNRGTGQTGGAVGLSSGSGAGGFVGSSETRGFSYGSGAGRIGGAGHRSRLSAGISGSGVAGGSEGIEGYSGTGQAVRTVGISGTGASGRSGGAARSGSVTLGTGINSPPRGGGVVGTTGGLRGTSGYSTLDGPAKIEFRIGEGQGFSTFGGSDLSVSGGGSGRSDSGVHSGSSGSLRRRTESVGGSLTGRRGSSRQDELRRQQADSISGDGDGLVGIGIGSYSSGVSSGVSSYSSRNLRQSEVSHTSQPKPGDVQVQQEHVRSGGSVIVDPSGISQQQVDIEQIFV